ncbi:MAG: hypothetical protein WBV93_09400 [Anaerobacillus sp.]
MDGAIFLWFAWIGVVITIFFLKASSDRNQLMFILLIAICLVNLQFHLASYKFTALFLLSWVTGYGLLLRNMQVKRLYAVIVVIMLTAAYTAIQLFSIYDPVFTYVYTKWSIAAVLFIIIHLTLTGTGQRTSFLILSIVHGEAILMFLFHQMGIARIGGEMASLDIIAICVMGTIVWNSFVQVTAQLEKIVKKHQERRGYS